VVGGGQVEAVPWVSQQVLLLQQGDDHALVAEDLVSPGQAGEQYSAHAGLTQSSPGMSLGFCHA